MIYKTEINLEYVMAKWLNQRFMIIKYSGRITAKEELTSIGQKEYI